MTRALIKKTACIVLSLSLICGGGLSWIVGSELIRPANHTVQLPPGLAAKLVSIPGQGHAIAGWWADRGSQSPIVLLLHGIRADRSSMAPRAAVLLSKGFSVLLIDFQAHGETLGQAITLGWRESSDVLAALAWLKAQGSRRRIGAIGVSLGGASILLGPQPMGFDAIVLEAVYPRIGRAVENRVRRRAGVLTPILSALLLAQIPLRLHVCPHDLEPIRYIAKVGAPVLVVAGSVDLDTTLGESDELFRAAIHPKQMWIVRGAGHQDFLRYDAAGYESHVIRFLIDQLQPAIKAS